MNARRVAPIIALVLAACGGGGGGGVPAIPTTAPSLSPNARMQNVMISLVVPVNSGTNGARRPAYISASALGAGIVVTQGSATVNATLNLSSSSSSCTGSGSSRTCTTSVTVPTGNDVFTITIYNQAPSNNTIPAGAAILGIGTSTVDVIAGSTSGVSVFVGGEIAHFGATIPSGSLPANGHAQSAVIVIAPTDFGDNPITAGTNDPYANPITVGVTESGGSGFASLSLNGGPASSSVLVTKSTDSVTLEYSGGGQPGYSFTVTLSAGGVTSQSSTIAPLIAAIGGSAVTSVGLNGTISNLTLAVGEAGSSRTYTAALTTCTNIATIGSLSGSGASATLPVNGGATASASGCTLTLTDSGNVALVLPVTNTPVTHSVTINGTQITEYGGWSGPYGMAVGPDGNIWLTDAGTDTVNSFNPSNGAGVFNLFISGSSLIDIVAGSDGAMWVTDANLEGVDRVTTTNTLTQYQLPSGGSPHGITSDSSGQLWVANTGPSSILTLSVGGAFNPMSISPSGQPSSIAVGPDGAIWFTEQTWIGRYNPADASFTETVVPNSGGAQYIAAGRDGAMWFTGSSVGGGFVARIPMNGDGPFTPTAYATTGTSPMGIAAGADNAMWFVDNVANTVNEISLTSHAITSFPLPTSGAAPQEIVRGPDGSLWLSEFGANQVAHVIP
jgi:virginiamycin B lyase